MHKGGILLTPEGLKQLEEELRILRDVKMPDIVERLSKAREDGDLSENTGYQQAREELEFAQGRLAELEEVLNNSSLVKQTNSSNVVNVGCKVTVTINGKKESFWVVGEWEANPVAKKISGNSPLGKALIGKKVGEKAEVLAPAGKVVYTVSAIE